ncbi:hypothetical protein [Dysgonomonas sp. Marseille-Q5470]|uniref:hypothetical protein n=1 Tax=Dysgonomonas sp. Marseille-Q5470 TaxID=3039494 RepID=UPI0024BC5E59|nr:hypothetical protein [Dysgonomonas sp. Marseille-Q5470]
MQENMFQSDNTFILPDQGNKITENDIKKNQLRITVAFKKYFPKGNDILQFEYNSEICNVLFTNRDSLEKNRSHILKLGKTLMQKLNLNSNSRVRITVLRNKCYKIEVV